MYKYIFSSARLFPLSTYLFSILYMSERNVKSETRFSRGRIVHSFFLPADRAKAIFMKLKLRSKFCVSREQYTPRHVSEISRFMKRFMFCHFHVSHSDSFSTKNCSLFNVKVFTYFQGKKRNMLGARFNSL